MCYMYGYLQKPEGSPGTGVMSYLIWVLGSEFGSLEEHQVFSVDP